MNKEFNCSVDFNVYLTNSEFEGYFEQCDEYDEYGFDVAVDDIITERLSCLQREGDIIGYDWSFKAEQDIEHTNIYNILTKELALSAKTYKSIVEYFDKILIQFHNQKPNLYQQNKRNKVIISDITLVIENSHIVLKVWDNFDSPLSVEQTAGALVDVLFNATGIDI